MEILIFFFVFFFFLLCILEFEECLDEQLLRNIKKSCHFFSPGDKPILSDEYSFAWQRVSSAVKDTSNYFDWSQQ